MQIFNISIHNLSIVPFAQGRAVESGDVKACFDLFGETGSQWCGEIWILVNYKRARASKTWETFGSCARRGFAVGTVVWMYQRVRAQVIIDKKNICKVVIVRKYFVEEICVNYFVSILTVQSSRSWSGYSCFGPWRDEINERMHEIFNAWFISDHQSVCWTVFKAVLYALWLWSPQCASTTLQTMKSLASLGSHICRLRIHTTNVCTIVFAKCCCAVWSCLICSLHTGRDATKLLLAELQQFFFGPSGWYVCNYIFFPASMRAMKN